MDSWSKNGYVLLSNVLDNNILDKSTTLLNSIYNNKGTASKDFGSDGKLEFPTGKVIDWISSKRLKCK